MTTYTKTFKCKLYYTSRSVRDTLLNLEVDDKTGEVQRPRILDRPGFSVVAVSVYDGTKLLATFRKSEGLL